MKITRKKLKKIIRESLFDAISNKKYSDEELLSPYRDNPAMQEGDELIVRGVKILKTADVPEKSKEFLQINMRMRDLIGQLGKARYDNYLGSRYDLKRQGKHEELELRKKTSAIIDDYLEKIRFWNIEFESYIPKYTGLVHDLTRKRRKKLGDKSNFKDNPHYQSGFIRDEYLR